MGFPAMFDYQSVAGKYSAVWTVFTMNYDDHDEVWGGKNLPSIQSWLQCLMFPATVARKSTRKISLKVDDFAGGIYFALCLGISQQVSINLSPITMY